MIGYLDDDRIPLILRDMRLSEMSGCVKASKDKGGDRNKKNKLLSLRIDDNNVLEKYKTIWVKIRDLKKYLLYEFIMIDI